MRQSYGAQHVNLEEKCITAGMEARPDKAMLWGSYNVYGRAATLSTQVCSDLSSGHATWDSRWAACAGRVCSASNRKGQPAFWSESGAAWLRLSGRPVGSLSAAPNDWPTHVVVFCLQREAYPALQGQPREATPADLADGGERAASAGSKDASSTQPGQDGQAQAGVSSGKGKQAGSSTSRVGSSKAGSSKAGSTPKEQVAAAKVLWQKSEGGAGTERADAKGWTAARVDTLCNL